MVHQYNTGKPIIDELSASMRPTLKLAAMALLFKALLSIPLGVLSAARKGGFADKSIYLFGIVCMSVPNYWIGFMLILAFAVNIPLFSIMGAENWKDFVLPALAIISDIFMALPPFLVAMTLVGLFESKALSIVISIAAAMWVWNAQVVRTYFIREKQKPYVITCRMSGCSELRIIMRHIIPNIFPHLLVLYSTGLSGVIIMISSYAFLGLGLETGTAEWGAMLVNANKLVFSHPELIVYPGLCILFAAAGFNLFGEALRDICDPKEG